jgi:type IV pilus assembly protein PilY1
MNVCPWMFLIALSLAMPELAAADNASFPATLCTPSSENSPAPTVAGEHPDTRYRARFSADGWTGELSKERWSSEGKTRVLWTTRGQLATPRQTLLPGTDGSLKPFTWANLNPQQQAALNRNAAGAEDGYGPARVSLLRGDGCSQLDGCATLRPSLPPLGDIVNSLPLVVSAPNRRAALMERYDGPPGAYSAFMAKPRRPQVYVGANDGMLHGFDAATGEERLALIPSALLADLPSLTAADYGQGSANPHRSFVDGALLAQDVYFADAWHTVLLVSLGAGARGMLALDVSDPLHVRVLWELHATPENDLGHLFGTPSIARLHTGQWAVLLGNGVAPVGNSAALLLVDVHTGALIKRLATPRAASGLAMPLVTDTNGDGNADYAYAGDSLGNLWRFDLFEPNPGSLTKATPPTTAGVEHFRLSFGGHPLFSTPNSPAQPISLAPEIVRHPTENGYLLLVGSGQNVRTTYPESRARQSLYGIWDRFTQGQNTQTVDTVSSDALQQQHLQNAGTITVGGEEQERLTLSREPIDWSASKGKLGWFIDLRASTASAAAERLLETPQMLGELLVVRTRRPRNEPCQSDAEQRLYVLDPTLGSSPLFAVFDVNGDGRVDDKDSDNGAPPFSLVAPTTLQIVVDPQRGMPCLLGSVNCAPLASGPRANGRQSWKVVTDVSP